MINDLLNNKKALGLLAGGVAGLALGLKMRKKAKLKCAEIMKTFVENQELIEHVAEVSDEYTEVDKENDININKTKTAIGIITAYAPTYITLVASGCVTINGIVKLYKGSSSCMQVE